MKYRKKPVTIDAFQLNPNEPVREDWFLDAISNSTVIVHSTYCDIKTLEGTMRANLGDYIIRGVNGEIYPCKPDIFEKTYELVESEECETCKELNKEPNPVFIDDIYIMTAGYYHWRREILYCPTCGKRISHTTESEKK